MFKAKLLAGVALAAFAFGITIGGVVAYKWAVSQEVSRLKTALELKDKNHAIAVTALTQYLESRPRVGEQATILEEGIDDVPKHVSCDVGPSEQRMLDHARTGVRASARDNPEGDRSPGTPAEPARIPRPVEVRAHVDAAVRYRECYSLAKAVGTYFKEQRR